jgi:hypothetical protein
MCSICAGNVCAGTGGCMVVVNHTPEVIKISYSYAGNTVSAMQSYFLALFTTTKDSFRQMIKNLRFKK